MKIYRFRDLKIIELKNSPGYIDFTLPDLDIFPWTPKIFDIPWSARFFLEATETCYYL